MTDFAHREPCHDLVIPNAHMPVNPHMAVDSHVGPGPGVNRVPGRGGVVNRKNQPKGFFEGVWDDVVNFF